MVDKVKAIAHSHVVHNVLHASYFALIVIGNHGLVTIVAGLLLVVTIASVKD